MLSRRIATRISLAAMVVAAAAVTGCGVMNKQSTLVALTTQLRGANEVPANASPGSGSVDAVFDTSTNLLRWKVNYTRLSGPATAGHFHGPAAIGANAGVALGWASPIRSPMDGSATLTPAQAADLMAGRWYANIHTAAYPAGEVRGQMTVVRN
ncbi:MULTISPECIES: CHRD domain-containing protein [unclassified Polaromonas]|uniref:CHRD domain-containing protein n=1 Tax=unclassified Polaromonas TaxID=2638319 RepID=UPI000F092202|nr:MULTISPECIES: CHRD domain-containing protein [unclassified Polaromonas]AYQ29707.1 CHRD domain-containing protein [Polaromonas sp. SP1]QGJ19178.1 CHRD domain-containing protein [Polaromonas sp. Pch-P]